MSAATPGSRGSEATQPGWEALARGAASGAPGEAVGRKLEFLSLLLDGEPYALPIERVREIVRLRPITPVPRAPLEIMGVISLRGEIVQVVDLRRCLGLEPIQPNPRSRIVVLREDDRQQGAGLLFDGVTEVLRVGEEEMRPAPGSDYTLVSRLCVQGGRFVSVIDLDRVLNRDERG